MTIDNQGGRTAATVAPWVVATAVAGTVLIALGAFWLSFTALTDLAARAGVPAGQAWVWPLIVDGILVVATISVVVLAPHGRRATWYPWTLLVGGALVSLGGNATHATIAADADVPRLLAAAIASVPPLVLLAITHLTVELTSRRARPSSTAGTADAPPVEAATTVDGRPDRPVRRRARPGPPGDGRARALALRAEGLSNRRIAAEVGVHPSTVGRWLADR